MMKHTIVQRYIILKYLMLKSQDRDIYLSPFRSKIGSRRIKDRACNAILSAMIMKCFHSYIDDNVCNLFVCRISSHDVGMHRTTLNRHLNKMCKMHVVYRVRVKHNEYVVNPEYVPGIVNSRVDDLFKEINKLGVEVTKFDADNDYDSALQEIG